MRRLGGRDARRAMKHTHPPGAVRKADVALPGYPRPERSVVVRLEGPEALDGSAVACRGNCGFKEPKTS